jgi:hypothetical protein
MYGKHYTHTDYFTAARSRFRDLQHLRTDNECIIFALYCAGVTAECIFRAYITKYTKEFDAKHNLEKLYEKSLLAQNLSEDAKAELTAAVKILNKFWSNDLRYTSEVRMKRILAHENARLDFKNIFKFLAKNKAELYSATELIFNTGIQSWT